MPGGYFILPQPVDESKLFTGSTAFIAPVKSLLSFSLITVPNLVVVCHAV